MPPTPTTPADPGEPRIRDRGDACPGALRLHAADDGRLARLRVPAGLLTSHQLMVLADAAERLGDGAVSITSRGNVELRGLADGCGAELAGLLRESGLLPSDTHERVRNVVASPLAGLDGLGCGDVQLWARELDALLCANGWAARLSGRFLFALDDGRGDVAGLGADVTLLAEAGGSAVLRVGAAAFRVRAADAARAALAAAGAFLEAASDTGAWRVRELPTDREPALGAHLERAGVPAETRPPDPGVRDTIDAVRAGPLPGIVKGPGGWSLSVAAPLGRLGVAQLRDLLPAPGGEVRLTPWRGVVVPGFGSRDAAGARLGRLADAGFVTDAGSPWYGVGACTGRPGCAKSLADVRADATAGARAGTAARHGGPPVYWSGCERRCGRPHGAYLDVVATADGTYRVTEPFSGTGTGTTSTSTSAAAQTSATATDPTDTRAQDRTSTTK